MVALVSLMSGVYRHSHRMIVSAMDDFFEVRMALGTVNRLRKEASIALSSTVLEAKNYIQSSEKVCADETGFTQGNTDGQNPTKKKAWLWVAVTPLVTFFQVFLSRSTQAAMDLLGENFEGILSSDRYGSYNWVDVKKRQICWAHLKREFQKISERNGVSRQIGRDLLAQTVRTCRQLLKMEVALWLFVEIEGLEPTNNEAERAIRPAVLWKRTSFGSQSQEGSVFVGRMLTVVSSLRCQNRNVLEFMIETIKAYREGKQTPSLIPPSQTQSDSNSSEESNLLVT